jgi:hypothetical protein
MLTTGVDPAAAGRLIGAFDGALLGWLAVRFARELELRGAAALVAASGVFWVGALTLFTGYNKAFAEMALVIAAVGTFGLRAARSGRGLVPLLLTRRRGSRSTARPSASFPRSASRARGRCVRADPSSCAGLPPGSRSRRR